MLKFKKKTLKVTLQSNWQKKNVCRINIHIRESIKLTTILENQ